MTLADYDYQVWRKALHDLQVKIDTFDNNFWEHVIEHNIEGEALEKMKKVSEPERQILVDELNAHYKTDPR